MELAGRGPELVYTDETHIDLLGCFAWKLYTPDLHNQMRKALEDAGVTGDLDKLVGAFATNDLRVAKYIADQAATIRSS
jgi:hypothetical protein